MLAIITYICFACSLVKHLKVFNYCYWPVQRRVTNKNQTTSWNIKQHLSDFSKKKNREGHSALFRPLWDLCIAPSDLINLVMLITFLKLYAWKRLHNAHYWCTYTEHLMREIRDLMQDYRISQLINNMVCINIKYFLPYCDHFWYKLSQYGKKVLYTYAYHMVNYLGNSEALHEITDLVHQMLSVCAPYKVKFPGFRFGFDTGCIPG